jgi:hypothetical protein
MNVLLEQSRVGWKLNIEADPATITIYRKPVKDNGFGKMVPNPFGHPVPISQKVRISYESQAADGAGPGGITEKLNRYIFCDWKGDIKRGDLFTVNGQSYEIGIIDEVRQNKGLVGFRAPLKNIVEEVPVT